MVVRVRIGDAGADRDGILGVRDSAMVGICSDRSGRPRCGRNRKELVEVALDFITTIEAADMLGNSYWTVSEWCRTGQLNCKRVGPVSIHNVWCDKQYLEQVMI
jgi:hypothetical protein